MIITGCQIKSEYSFSVLLLAALEVILSDRGCEIGKDVGISEAVSCFNKIQA